MRKVQEVQLWFPPRVKLLINQPFPTLKKKKKTAQGSDLPHHHSVTRPIQAQTLLLPLSPLPTHSIPRNTNRFHHCFPSFTLYYLFTHTHSLVCWAPIRDTHDPYRRVGVWLPFSRVWRLEVGSSRCDETLDRVWVCVSPRLSSPAGQSLYVKLIGLKMGVRGGGIMTLAYQSFLAVLRELTHPHSKID